MSGNFYDSLNLKYEVNQKVFVRMYDKNDRPFLVPATIEKVSGFDKDTENKYHGIYEVSIIDKFRDSKYDKRMSLMGTRLTVPEDRIVVDDIVIVGSGRRL